MSYAYPVPTKREGLAVFIGDYDTWTTQQAEAANRKYPGCMPTQTGLMHLMRTWWLLETESPPHGRLRNLAWAERAFDKR